MTGKLFSSNDMILRKKINFENVVAFITGAASWNRQEYDNCDTCYYHIRRHLKLKKYDKNIENY